MAEVKAFNSLFEVNNAISQLETTTKTKFSVYQASKGFGGSHDLTLQKHRIYFEDQAHVPHIPNCGTPYIQLGYKQLDCHRGKNRHLSQKTVSIQEHDHDFKKCKIHLQDSKKIGCMARIVMKKIMTFPDYKIENPTSDWLQRKASKSVREMLTDGKIKGTIKFIVQFPALQDHDVNCTTKAAGISLPVDSRLIQHIQGLIGEGVRSVADMQRHVCQYTKTLFAASEMPPRPDRRFYPGKQDIKNAMYQGVIKNRLSNIDQDNLQLEIQLWNQQKPGDKFLFRPHSASSIENDENLVPSEKMSETSLYDDVRVADTTPLPNKLLFVHQTQDQQHLLRRYGNELCLLDATYRTTRYSLPLFFIAVKTNAGYLVVASFVIQDETEASIKEALGVVQSWNPSWKPQFFMTDYCQEEIHAVEEVFTDCRVYICDFHREQAWTRWTRNRDNGVHECADEVLPRLRRIARASTESSFHAAVQSLQDCDVWMINKKLVNWFTKIWLSCSERWVWAFRKDRFLVNINTNNGLERQNETFKHTYLQKHRTKTLSQMVKTLVEEYLPEQYDKYIEQNVKSLHTYRKYNTQVPHFLHDHPREFVTACMERYYLAEGIPRCDIKYSNDKNIFTVMSQTNSSEQKGYRVFLGDQNEMPSCSCYDWEHSFTPCKHIIAVILTVEGVNWDSISPLYRLSPFITIDDSVVKCPGTRNYIYPLNCDSNTDDNVTVEDESTETIHVPSIDLPLPKHNRSLAAECRETLKHITSMTYLVQDAKVLSSMRDQLHIFRQEIEDALPKESGLILEPNSHDNKPNPKRVCFSNVSKPDMLPLPVKNRKHPYSGRVGRKAEMMKKSYLCKMPIEENEIHIQTTEECPDFIVNPSTSLPLQASFSNSDDVEVIGESHMESGPRSLHRKLQADDMNRIRHNHMLQDNEINLAQSFLKKQFSGIEGLEDTTLGPVKQFSIFHSEFVQILHDGELHWVCVSNISCEKGHVNCYDSLNRTGTCKPEIQRLIASVLFESSPEIKVTICPIQQQTNSVDCGVFAIAVATSLLHGQDPSKQVYDVSKMRFHLLDCLHSNALHPFPTFHHRLKTAQRCQKGEIHIELFCVCRRPWFSEDLKDNNLSMAECDQCRTWYHRGCVSIPSDVFTHGTHWKCPSCI